MPLRDKDWDQDKLAADLLRRSLASPAGANDACPDPEILAAYSERSLDAEEAARCNLHFSQCARCREQLATLVRSGELAGTAEQKPSRSPGIPWIGAGNWDRRWIAPAAAALVFVAVVVVFRPPHHPHEQPLVAINQPAAPLAAPPMSSVKPQSSPAAVASAPSTPIAPISRIRSAPNVNSDESDIARPAAPPPAPPAGKESDVPATLSARNSAQTDALAKPSAAPQAGVSSQSGSEIGHRVGNRVGIAAPPPRATQTVTVEDAVSPLTPAAPAPSEKKTAQANGAVSSGAIVTQESTNGQQMSMVIANRNLTQTESVMVQAGDATSARTLVRTPDPQVLWRFSGGRFVERSSDAGATWRAQWTNANAHLVAGTAPTTDTCWLVGRAGMVLVTVDGKKWKQIAPPADADFVDVAATDASSATVTSADGRKFTTSDRGNHWTPEP